MDEEEALVFAMQTHLFLLEVFVKLLPKVLHILEILFNIEVETPDPNRPAVSTRTFPQGGGRFPLPWDSFCLWQTS